MYPSVLQYQFIVGDVYAKSVCNCTGVLDSQLYQWLYYGKLPVTASATPTYDTQVITSGEKNRYLASVTVNRIPVVTGTVTLAAAATATYTFTGAASATTSNAAYATATVLNGVVTITGVAAGTSTVNILDINGLTIATIVVTVA